MLCRVYVRAQMLTLAVFLSGCHGMNPFAADLGAAEVGGKVARAPYMSQFSYLGRCELQEAQLSRADATGQVSVYFWLPMSTPELGVRFISGAHPQVHIDGHKDVVETGYIANVKDDSRFDPTLELQRCLTVMEPQDVTKACGQWVSLGQNDDSQEMPEVQEGVLIGSLLRVSNEAQDPLKTLTQGLYRVVIGGAKNTMPKGNFLLQLGAPVLLDAVAMGRSPEGLLVAIGRHDSLQAPQGGSKLRNDGASGLDGTAMPLVPNPTTER